MAKGYLVNAMNLHDEELRSIQPLTAVTFGWSIQGSTLSGPTELTTTMVFLWTLATALTKLSPLAQAVKFLRSPTYNHNGVLFNRWFIRREGLVSHTLPSTARYPSPEFALMNTRAASVPRATFWASARSKSSKCQSIAVPSFLARP